MSEITRIKGSITAPKGFLGGCVESGIKERGKKDLALIYSKRLANSAGVFTINKLKSAPVLITSKKLERGKAQAIIINSGCANAYTGEEGLRNGNKMAEMVANGLGISPKYVLVASTGITGKQLPMEKIERGIKKLVNHLKVSSIAEGIMTTDKRKKEIAVEVKLNGKRIRIGGVAKGAGMIAPNMATLLCFITTDACVEQNLLKKALVHAVNNSFNHIIIDGDMSPSDMVIVLANGLARNRKITGGKEYILFRRGLEFVCTYLAKLIVNDGEGATKFVEIRVKNAVSDRDAKKVALSVAKSPLVKTALFGSDPNWGRILCAVGYSGAKVNEKIDIYFNNLLVVKNGVGIVEREEAKKELKKKNIMIIIDLKMGRGNSYIWTTDLSYEYIKINAEYIT